MSLFSRSGGLVYHARAARLADGPWQPFRRCVARWLAGVLPPAEELLLVGPSAGHCLPLEQLAAFGSIRVLDPDSLARWLLARRLKAQRRALSIESVARDELLEPLLSGAPGIEGWLERHRQASVLFCNVLGQLQLELNDEQQARFEQAFRQRILPLLADRPWASFHDRWSLDFAPDQSVPQELRFGARPSDDELGRGLFGDGGPAVEVLDHGTERLFPAELPRRYFSWHIARHALHVVEALPGSQLASAS